MSVDAESLASFRPDKENRRARPIPMQMEHRESARLHEQSSVEEAPATAPARGRFTPPPDHGTPADGTLFGTEQLNAKEVERLLASRHARLVVCLGEEGSGKTSLCIELYERQRGRATGADFAGSWTLLAFEQLAHRRRTTGDVRPTSTDESISTSAPSCTSPCGPEVCRFTCSSPTSPASSSSVLPTIRSRSRRSRGWDAPTSSSSL